MGLLDQLGGSLKGALGSVAAAEAPALISAALAKTNMGNLQGLVDQLQQGGLGEQVKSWLGNGANLQVTPEQIQSALGSDQVKQLAQHFGVSPDAVAKLLADHLPAAVDQAEPGWVGSRVLKALVSPEILKPRCR
jgi:uncharacterized protein YidB (DUF937 family)